MRRFRKTIRHPESLRKKNKTNPYSKFDKIIDLHGLTVADAERVVKNVIAANIGKRILINHGKGEGVLRQSVRALCSKDSRVLEIKKGEDSLVPGGEGITIIQL